MGPTWRTSLRMLLEKPSRFGVLVMDWVGFLRGDVFTLVKSFAQLSIKKLWLKKCYAAAVNLHQSADHTYNLFGDTDCLSWRRFCSSHLMFTLNGDKCKFVLSACPWCLPFEDTMFEWFACPGPRLIFISQTCSGGYNHEPQTTPGF